MQQTVRVRHVRLVRRRRCQAVRHPGLRVRAHVHLHPEVPLVSLLRLMHLWISLPRAVFFVDVGASTILASTTAPSSGGAAGGQ